MTEPISTGLATTLAGGGVITTIGLFFGVDPIALFCAFMGTIIAHGLTPKIALSYETVKQALAWALVAMVFGTLGGMIAEVVVENHYSGFKDVPHVAAVGFPSLILAFASRPILSKGLKLLSDWKLNK